MGKTFKTTNELAAKLNKLALTIGEPHLPLSSDFNGRGVDALTASQDPKLIQK